MALKLFVDFDGTITRQHETRQNRFGGRPEGGPASHFPAGRAGNAFFREFGGDACDVVVQEFLEGRISAKECFRREIEAIGTLDLRAASAFLQRQTIDPGFKEFVSVCRESGTEFHVLSDGLDYCIRKILAANEIDGVSYFANTLELGEEDPHGRANIAITFPYSDSECSRCACCKRNVMLTHAGESDVIAYIGAGYSDRCPAQYADIVFAKDELQTYCQQENISYFVYQSFNDVVARLRVLLTRTSLQTRRKAELKRREAFMRES